uniref:Uncharacterized protein n=1 Tax=Amphimedon queenslandica TaxID=400682 RepID=A0A1X7VIC9_AMPQE
MIEYDSLNDETKDQIYSFILHCDHPITGEFMYSTLKVHKDELLPTVLNKAYELMELAPFPIERCRLVKYYESYYDIIEESLDLDEFQHQTIGQIVGGTKHHPFQLYIETREENESFYKYNEEGTINYNAVVKLTIVFNNSSNVNYFIEGIEPMWEDKTNKDGGRWLLNINKRRRKCGVLDNVWIETLMCLIGEVFDDSSDDICGAMVQNRTKGDKISIWTRVAKNKEHVYRIGYCFWNSHVYKEKIKIHIFEPFTIQYESHLDVVTRSSNRTLFTITCPHEFKEGVRRPKNKQEKL